MKNWMPVWLSCLFLPLAVLAEIKQEGKDGVKPAPQGTVVAAEATQVAEGKDKAPAENARSADAEATRLPLEKPVILGPNGVPGPIVVFPFKSEVDPALQMFMRRSLKEAERMGASAFVIEMDTPGGRLDVTLEMLEMLHKTKVPTVTFINPHALSAGAFISLGTKRIYMRPDASIGAAAVVSGQGEDIGKTIRLKLDSFMASKLRAICEENGHNPDVAEAFMVVEKELKMGDKVIDSKDTLLSLNGREAAKVYDGKPLLANGLAETLEEVLKTERLTGEVIRMEPTGFEQVAFWITMLSPLLLMGGIVGAYIEMKAPGFGIPGIVSLICFGLFFGGHFIAGLSGYETAVVFAIGLVLVIVEFFVLPGTFIPGLIGTLLMLGALLFAMVDHWPSNPGMPGGADLERPMINFITALAGTAVIIAILAKILPKTSIYNRLVLSSASANGPTITIPVPNLTVKTGDVGEATTTLRPAGKASFGSEVHDVVTGGDFITVGTRVRIVEVDGMRVVVEAV